MQNDKWSLLLLAKAQGQVGAKQHLLCHTVCVAAKVARICYLIPSIHNCAEP